jgi:hypothetical protein
MPFIWFALAVEAVLTALAVIKSTESDGDGSDGGAS